MNPAIFGGLPASACTLGTTGTFGADRLTRSYYDAASEVQKVTTAYGTGLQQDAQTYTYTPNGAVASLKDARGYLTEYQYDGHDRLYRTCYPVALSQNTSCCASGQTPDTEQSTYSNTAGATFGLVTQVKKRGNAVYNLTYDNLARLTLRDAPGTMQPGEQPNVSFGYDLLSRMTAANQTAPSVHNLTYVYEQLSRLTSEQSSIFGTVSFQWDSGGRRTRLTWPGSYYVDYDYDFANAMTKVRENGATSGAGVLATYGYDNLGRRATIARGNGVSSTLGYDGISRLASFSHDAAGTAQDQTYGFTYNPSSQVLSQSASNAAYDRASPGTFSNAYTVDGLNKYLTAGGVSIQHDARGNLQYDGSKTYAYDADNRLTSVSGGASATLSYDPAGRLHQNRGRRDDALPL
ncbi:MAG: hypothetical protein ABL957_15625 [Parvularculaceae bacterium]